MKTLIGLLSAMDGSVAFEGRDISGMKPHQRAHLGRRHVPAADDEHALAHQVQKRWEVRNAVIGSAARHRSI